MTLAGQYCYEYSRYSRLIKYVDSAGIVAYNVYDYDQYATDSGTLHYMGD